MKITEKDIFNFIFSPGELESDKYSYIEINKNDFAEQIEYCIQLKNDADKSQIEPPEKLYSLTSLVKKKKVIDFMKIEKKTNRAAENYKLAAASPELEDKVITDTYINQKEKFLIKVVSTNESNKIYLFNETGSEVNNFQFILSPSGRILSQETNNIPAVVNPPDKIENIKLLI